MPEGKHRLVVDTNLWISFLLTRSLDKLDQLFSKEDATFLISRELLEEITEVAQRPKFKKYFILSELTDLLYNLMLHAELVQVNSHIDVCRDDKDNFLLSLAVDANATHILTGDKDLLVLHPFREIHISTISDYLSIYRK